MAAKKKSKSAAKAKPKKAAPKKPAKRASAKVAKVATKQPVAKGRKPAGKRPATKKATTAKPAAKKATTAKPATKKAEKAATKATTAKATAAAPKGAAARPPVDKAALDTPEAREGALDRLGAWFVEALVGAAGNLGRAEEIIREAIGAFYDIRESAEQERGEYAGHFFMVDAVGIDDADRPVPWFELEKKVSPELMHQYEELFTSVEPTVR